MTRYEPGACPLGCGATAETLADVEAVRAEVEALWAFHTRRLRPDTPPRHLLDRLAFTQKPPLGIARCGDCGTLFRSPAERDIDELYAAETVDDAALRALHDAQLDFYRDCAHRLTEAAEGTGAGLEVGSYVGAFLSAAHEAGWRFEGVDVNPVTNAFARRLGHTVHDGVIAAAPGTTYDAIAIWNCFEQLADPRGTLVEARARLRPGGILVLRVPNGEFYAVLRARLHGSLGGAARALLATNNLLGFPYRHGFDPTALGWLAVATGFAPESVRGDSLVPTADRWTRRWAALEERVVKRLLRGIAGITTPPWFELWCRAV